MLINQLFSVFQKILHSVIFGYNSEHWMASDTLIKSHKLCSKPFTKWITKNPKQNRLANRDAIQTFFENNFLFKPRILHVCLILNIQPLNYLFQSYLKCQLKPFIQVLKLQILYLSDISTDSLIAKKPCRCYLLK